MIDDKIWRQGPRAVNAEILRLIQLHTRRPRPSRNSATPSRCAMANSRSPIPRRLANSTIFAIGLAGEIAAYLSRLLEKTHRVGNTHPDLLSIVSEYSQLIAQPTETLDVVALWAVGTGLLANRETFGRLPQAGVMAEPLEPEHLALLQQVAAIHGGFILGFELARKLTSRADQSRLSPEAAAAIMPPARDLLGRWSRAAEYVEARTRSFFGAIAEAAIEPSWRAARAGYSVYAVTRDSLIAIGKRIARISRCLWSVRSVSKSTPRIQLMYSWPFSFCSSKARRFLFSVNRFRNRKYGWPRSSTTSGKIGISPELGCQGRMPR